MGIKKYSFNIILSLVIVAGLIYGFWPEAILVDTAKVVRGPLTVIVEEEGKTRVIDRFVISSPITAYARRIGYYVGDAVTQNDILVELEPLPSAILDPRSRAEAQARLEAARSAFRAAEQNAQAAKADLDYARQEVTRMEKLQKSRTIAEEKLDQARAAARRTEATYRSAIFDVEVTRFKLDEAQKTLEYSVANSDQKMEQHFVKSPVNGKILKIHRKSEGVVQLGEPLLEIGDPKALEVEVDVLSMDAVKIHPNSKVVFTRWGGEDTLEGIVDTVEPTGFTKVSALGVEEQRVNVIANITSPYEAWQRLGDGYRVDAGFIIWRGEGLLVIPASSLFRKNNQWAVFKIEQNRAKPVPVQIEHSNGLLTEIKAGLSEGDVIISYPDATIQEGTRVRARKKEI